MPLIELNGAGVGTDRSLIDSGGSTVRGLVINRFGGSGMDLGNGSHGVVAWQFFLQYHRRHHGRHPELHLRQR